MRSWKRWSSGLRLSSLLTQTLGRAPCTTTNGSSNAFPAPRWWRWESGRRLIPLTVTAGSALDHEGQLRAIARQIKQRLVDNPGLRPSDCAVAFRQVSPYISLARQVFAEYDLPLDPAVGERLRNRPLGVWLLRLLRLAQDGWRLRDLTAVLSSGFVDLQRWGLSWDDVARFARKGRENHLWAGPDRMQDIVEALRAEAGEEEVDGAGREALRRTAGGMAEAIEELRALLDQPPAPAADHARRLDEALFGASGLVPAVLAGVARRERGDRRPPRLPPGLRRLAGDAWRGT